MEGGVKKLFLVQHAALEIFIYNLVMSEICGYDE
jgi:hypothetical protein